MKTKLPRRDVLQLLGVGVVGWGASQLFQLTAPIGTDVRTNSFAAGVLADTDVPASKAPGADLTLAVFTDYFCPVCKLSDTALDEAVAEDGRVHVLYKDWPILSQLSEHVARVVLATHPQGIYEKLRARLMRDRRWFDDRILQEMVEDLGGSWHKTLSALHDDEPEITRRLVRNQREAFGLGLSGTPGFLIGPLLVNKGLTAREFARAFDRAREIAASG
jgi:protein-disulfide isomerase